MSLTTLGRRYERLLFFSAPLGLASILTLYVASATEVQKARSAAQCKTSAASLLESNLPALEAALRQPDEKRPFKAGSASVPELLYTFYDTPCRISLHELMTKSRENPTRFIAKLRDEARELMNTPFRYPGIEIPSNAKVDVFGTQVKVEVALFVSGLQIVLAPLLLLWLGSLYNTRYRETLLIAKARAVSEVFPHLVNVYPSIRYAEPRRRSFVQPYLAGAFAALYAAFRISLLLLFVGPTVAAYVAGIALAQFAGYAIVLYALGALVGIFSVALLVCELFPWHYRKTFS